MLAGSVASRHRAKPGRGAGNARKLTTKRTGCAGDGMPGHSLRREAEGPSEQDIAFEQATLGLQVRLRTELVQDQVKTAPWTIAWLHNNFWQKYSLHADVCQSFEGY